MINNVGSWCRNHYSVGKQLHEIGTTRKVNAEKGRHYWYQWVLSSSWSTDQARVRSTRTAFCTSAAFQTLLGSKEWRLCLANVKRWQLPAVYFFLIQSCNVLLKMLLVHSHISSPYVTSNLPRRLSRNCCP